jgi:sugar phosphate isomerase/epimerase
MEIGFSNNPAKPLLKQIEWVGRNGFAFFQLNIEEPFASPKKINVAKTRTLLEKYNLETIGHVAWYLPIGSPEKRIRTYAIKEASKQLAVMERLGTRLVTVHANWFPSLPEKKSIKIQAESFKALVEIANKRGMKIMIEQAGTPYDSEKNIDAIISRVPGLLFNLDIGHANLFGNSPIKFIKKFHSRIAHVHMHDNNGIMDTHLPIGSGIIEWKSVIRELKKHYNGTIALEVFTDDNEFVLLSRKRLIRLWSSC